MLFPLLPEKYWVLFDQTADQRSLLLGISPVLMFLSLTTMIMRFVSRRITKVGYRLDDWLVLAALVRQTTPYQPRKKNPSLTIIHSHSLGPRLCSTSVSPPIITSDVTSTKRHCRSWKASTKAHTGSRSSTTPPAPFPSSPCLRSTGACSTSIPSASENRSGSWRH